MRRRPRSARSVALASVLLAVDATARGHGVRPELVPRACARNAGRPETRARRDAMYLAAVVLGVPHSHLAPFFGCGRSNVHKVLARAEDRRDRPDYDAFLSRCEAGLLARVTQ